jgi:CBS domain-containing protein
MQTRVKDIMLPLSEYAVVSEDATILDALEALRASQSKLPTDRQPHRAVLVRNARGEITGKVHYFAFLRAMVPERKAMQERLVMDRAGVGDDLRESSMRMLDFLTGHLVDFRERARSVAVRDVYTAAAFGIDEGASMPEAISMFLSHQTLSLLVRRGAETVGILRLSDLFDELSRQILRPEPVAGTK